MTDSAFHYPPELFNLMVEAISKLFRGKEDVLLFFRGAGVPASSMQDLSATVRRDRDSIRKADIARTVLTRLNEKGDVTLRERREVLKRITEFEDFSTCWPADQLQAKGLVAEIRRVVNVKDSFTRMNEAREAERRQHLDVQEARQRELEKRRSELSVVKDELHELFREKDPRARGKALEKVLNRMFEASGILVREAFTLIGDHGEGIVEQIDGVVELAGHLYLVEMKWWNKPLGKGDVAEHLVRLFNRGEARGIFISSQGYSDPAVTCCKEALQQKVVVLCVLEEIILLFEREGNLAGYLKQKIDAAITDKNPLYRPSTL